MLAHRSLTLGIWHRELVSRQISFSEAYFKATTHFSAIQMVSAGLASCHIPATLIANLPKSIKENLNFFDIGAGRQKHLFSISEAFQLK